jgi:hypothetical protein
MLQRWREEKLSIYNVIYFLCILSLQIFYPQIFYMVILFSLSQVHMQR